MIGPADNCRSVREDNYFAFCPKRLRNSELTISYLYQYFLNILNSLNFKQNYIGMDYFQPHMSAEGRADELSFWIESSPLIMININLTLIYLN